MAIVDPQSTTFQRSEAWRLALDGATACLASALESTTRRSRRNLQARGDRRRGQRLHRAQRRRVGRAREGVGARTSAPTQRAEQAAQRRAAARARSRREAGAPARRAEGRRRLDDHPAAGEEPVPERRAQLPAQGAGAASSPGSSRRSSASGASSRSTSTASSGAKACSAPRPRRGATSASAPRALGAQQAAQLAVMLPAPKRFEKRPGSPYVVGRAATIVARMGQRRRALSGSARRRVAGVGALPRIGRWPARTAPRSPSRRRG